MRPPQDGQGTPLWASAWRGVFYVLDTLHVALCYGGEGRLPCREWRPRNPLGRNWSWGVFVFLGFYPLPTQSLLPETLPTQLQISAVCGLLERGTRHMDSRILRGFVPCSRTRFRVSDGTNFDETSRFRAKRLGSARPLYPRFYPFSSKTSAMASVKSSELMAT